MLVPGLTPDEDERLQELLALNILDTPAEEPFDRIVRLAQRLFDVPIALVSLIDTDRQWFKACYGLSASPTPRARSFGGHAILHDEPLVVSDAAQDPRFADNPLVTGEPKIRFYAGYPVRGPRGDKLGTVCVIDRRPRTVRGDELETLRDLAGLVEAEIAARVLREALRLETSARSRMQDFFDNAHEIIQLVAPDGRFVYVNHAWQAVLGYQLHELSSRSIFDLLAPEFLPHCQQVFARMLTEGTAHDLDVVYIAKDGRRVTLVGSSTCDFEDGQPHMTRGFFRDVTAVRRADQRAQHVISAAPIAMLVISRQGEITLSNEKAHQLFGYAHSELRGAPIERLLPQVTYQTGGAEVASVRDSRSASEVTARDKDGHERPVEVGFSPMAPDAASEIVVSIIDRTERRQIEAELREAKDVSEQANRAKSDFLTSMSHELRTPLNAILGFAQLFEMDPGLSSQARENAKEVEQAGHHLLRLINDIFDLATIDADRISLAPRPVLLATVIEEAVAQVAPMARTRGIEISTDLGGSPHVMADPLRLRQVTVNLLINAIKCSGPSGRVRLVVERSDHRVRVNVHDKGEGGEDDERVRAFQAFDRVGHAQGHAEGSGLGLLLSKRLIEAMNGEIGGACRRGEGTTFWYEVPRVTNVDDARRALSASQGPRAPTAAARAVVLHVEATPSNLRLMRQVFATRPAVQLRDAPNAELGLALARELRPALVLMDADVLGMDGIDLVKQLRSDPELAGVPVIGISSNAMDRDARRGLDAGFSSYLAKPIDLKLLLARVDEILASLRSPAVPAWGEAPSGTSEQLRILAVDDYAPNRLLLQDQLPALGYAAVVATDGADALARWQAGRFDLILTDLNMPGMDGATLAREVRKRELASGRRTPILAVSASDAVDEQARCAAAGIDDILTKPLSLSALREGLERWLGPRARTPARAPAPLDVERVYAHLGRRDQAQARALIAAFIDAARVGLAELGARSTAADVAHHMHRQRTGAQLVGATRYGELAGSLEQQVHRREVVDFAARLGGLQGALAEVEEAARQLDGVVPAGRLDDATPPLALGIVLIVDDDPVVLHQLIRLATNLGIGQVLAAGTARRAFEIIREQGRFLELAVCDLNMPETDGVEVVRALGANGFLGRLILMSGYSKAILESVGRLARLQGLNVLGELEKPIRAEALRELLTRSVGRARRPASPEPRRVSVHEIRRAIQASEFSIWLQPKVTACGLRPFGVEALARWRRADGSFVPPDVFIDVAEREGLIGELSSLLIDQAMEAGAALHAVAPELGLSLNLSATWLSDLGLPAFLCERARAAGLAPEAITLEITETGVMQDLATALDVLTRMRLKGFGLSIDDFGVGYSSFEQLLRIPFTELKLDRSFVSSGTKKFAARAILEGTMEMARKLHLVTVAEGVETADELELVRTLGCDHVQGYLIAKPMPVDELIQWLSSVGGDGCTIVGGSDEGVG